MVAQSIYISYLPSPKSNSVTNYLMLYGMLVDQQLAIVFDGTVPGYPYDQDPNTEQPDNLGVLNSSRSLTRGMQLEDSAFEGLA